MAPNHPTTTSVDPTTTLPTQTPSVVQSIKKVLPDDFNNDLKTNNNFRLITANLPPRAKPLNKISTTTPLKINQEYGRPPVPPQSQLRVRKQLKITRPTTPTNTIETQLHVRSNVTPLDVSLKLPVTKSSSFSEMINGSFFRTGLRSKEYSIQNSRSPSPISGYSSISNLSSLQNSSRQQQRRSLTPHRIFPQSYTRDNGLKLSEFNSLEPSSVVFDANLSFVLGCKKQPVHQTFRPSPAHLDSQTASNYLSTKIENFLKRTDHVMEEWQSIGNRSRGGHADDDMISLIENQRQRHIENGTISRSRSVTNILIKGYQLSKTLPSTPRSRSTSVARDLSQDDDDRTITDNGEVILTQP